MSRTTIFGALLAAGLVWGLVSLLNLEFEDGAAYPEYSSLRADPLGSKLLFDTLARVPDATVTRNFGTLDDVPSAATLLFLATRVDDFADSADDLRKVADRGVRVVVALHGDAKTRAESLITSWRLVLATDGSSRQSHPLYFSDAPGWTVLDHAGPKILAVEKTFGKGSVAVWSESDDFANESTAAGDRFDTVTKALGPNIRIVFDERHFGIAESGSVVALARHFHFTGLALGLGLCAALLLWRNGATFPPPAAATSAGTLAGRTSHAGLITLLRRNIPRERLAAQCWEEWLAGNRREAGSPKAVRAAALVQQGAGRPLETMREIQSVLQAKGEL